VVRNSSSSLSKAAIGLFFLRSTLKTEFISTDTARKPDVVSSLSHALWAVLPVRKTELMRRVFQFQKTI
jgi:hypothetical protein